MPHHPKAFGTPPRRDRAPQQHCLVKRRTKVPETTLWRRSVTEDDDFDDDDDDDASVEYPMSEYSDDDEPLHEKPLVPGFKKHLIPWWARRENDGALRKQLEQQATMPCDAIFCDEKRETDMVAIFGYEPPPSCRRQKRARRPLYSPSPKRHCGPSPGSSSAKLPVLNEDVEMRLVAATDLPLSDGVLATGFEYVAIMREDDSLQNLRRHYAKHNHLTEGDLLFADDHGRPLDLSSTPRRLHLSRKATLFVHLVSNPPRLRPRVSRRISDNYE